jgi:hypothetical protein
MKSLLFAAAAVAVMSAAVPAFAQGYVGGGPTPGGVDAAPVTAPYYSEYWRRGDACRLVRERIETPSGRVISRTQRECD